VPEAARSLAVNLHVRTALGELNRNASCIPHCDFEARQRICWPHVDRTTVGLQEQPAAWSDLKRLGDGLALRRSRMHDGDTPQDGDALQDHIDAHP